MEKPKNPNELFGQPNEVLCLVLQVGGRPLELELAPPTGMADEGSASFSSVVTFRSTSYNSSIPHHYSQLTCFALRFGGNSSELSHLQKYIF